MHVLLTGSSGFIGSHLVDVLRAAGHHVRGLDREQPDGPGPDEFVHGDLLEPGVLKGAFKGIDCVFHLAAAKDDWGISREEYFRDNVDATERLIRLGTEHDVSRWFHYSTVGVLAPGPDPTDEQAPLSPTTDYGASKARAEELFADLARQEPAAEIMILRPSAVFGPSNPPTTNVHRLIEAILDGRFVMVGDGETPKTTSYLENLLEATTFLLGNMRPGMQIRHYVDYPVMTTDFLIDTIFGVLSKDRPDVRVPLFAAKWLASVSDVAAAVTGVDFPITADRIEKFCTATNFDASTIRELGFSQPVANEEAVYRTVEWHLERRAE